MGKRFVAIWFRRLTTDWLQIRRHAIPGSPIVVAGQDHGRLVIISACALASTRGISVGMALADARAICPGLQVFDNDETLAPRLLTALGRWCIRFTPVVALDAPDGLLLDISGCAHLWGGERPYLREIVTQLKGRGYDVRVAMADTIGAAWAVSRYGSEKAIIECGEQHTTLLSLPPAALRLEHATVLRLQKLGLKQIGNFISMPRRVLRRRFGEDLLQKIDYATGMRAEPLQPLFPVTTYQERLPCLEPIKTRTGIEIGLKNVLDALCHRLQREGKGARQLIFRACRVDGKIEQVEVGTNRASHHAEHLFRLFEHKLQNIEPALGIDLFILEAPVVEESRPPQQAMWKGGCELDDPRLSELIDKFNSKPGVLDVQRFLPDAHHWPERSIKPAVSLQETTSTEWISDRPRPIRLLSTPVAIQVTAPIPDYPPMLFHYNGKIHRVKKADSAERIEREWWMEEGEHRDYYVVEDEDGRRYWLFRSGHYSADKIHGWFLHGFFA